MAGAAFRIFVVPPSSAISYRLLRRATDEFTGHNDPGALLVYEGDAHVLMDLDGLVNGTPYHYHLYAWNGSAWSDAGGAMGTPAATYADESADVLTIVRDRIDAGLQAEIAAGRLAHKHGRIPVLTAPPQAKDVTLPIVTIQLTSDASGQRGIGEAVEDDGDFDEFEGWLSNVRLDVKGWTWNPDARSDLRRALKRIVLANLPVFDHYGVSQVDFPQNDSEDFTSYDAPMYLTNGSFTCVAVSQVVGGDFDVITDVSVMIVDLDKARVLLSERNATLALRIWNTVNFAWMVRKGVLSMDMILTPLVANGKWYANGVQVADGTEDSLIPLISVDLSRYTMSGLIDYINAIPGFSVLYHAPDLLNAPASALADGVGTTQGNNYLKAYTDS